MRITVNPKTEKSTSDIYGKTMPLFFHKQKFRGNEAKASSP